MRDEIVYSKLYYPVTKDESNINRNFEKDIDLSVHISLRLKRMTMMKEDLKMLGKVITFSIFWYFVAL